MTRDTLRPSTPRLLGKKTLEAEILKEALEHATGSKKQLRLPPSPAQASASMAASL
jgi:hypothetical protein